MKDKKTLAQRIIDMLLNDFSQAEINSILLKVFEKKSENVSAMSILHQYENSRFTVPAKVNQKQLNFFDFLAYSLIPKSYEAIELSPVTVFGLNRLLTPISQKNVLGTIRKSEVVSDTASALIPEIVRRVCAEKKQNSHYINNVCSSHRCLRLQSFDNNPEFTAHFRVFSLASTWHKANKAAINKNIYEHLYFYLSLLHEAKNNHFDMKTIAVEISHIPLIETILRKHHIDKKDIQAKTQKYDFNYIQFYKLPYPEYSKGETLLQYFEKDSEEMPYLFELLSIWKQVVFPLKKDFPETNFFIDLKRVAGVGYYNGPCFKIIAHNSEGKSYPLVDGGMVDWIQKLIQTDSFNLLTSCIGSELFCRFFKVESI